MGDIPQNQVNWENEARRMKYKCSYCYITIPFGEQTIYFKHKLCSKCFHDIEKLKEE